ncbi:hypothetical protein cco23_08736, partial [Campylobacter coli 1098]
AYKAWYKGGWIKFIFNLLKLKKNLIKIKRANMN